MVGVNEIVYYKHFYITPLVTKLHTQYNAMHFDNVVKTKQKKANHQNVNENINKQKIHRKTCDSMRHRISTM